MDLLVKRNQAFIITHFSKTREKCCDHLLGEGVKEPTSLDTRRRSSVEESKRKDTKLARMELLIKVRLGFHVLKMSAILNILCSLHEVMLIYAYYCH